MVLEIEKLKSPCMKEAITKPTGNLAKQFIQTIIMMMQYPVNASNHAPSDSPIKKFLGNKYKVNNASFGLWPQIRLINSYKGYHWEERKGLTLYLNGKEKASLALFCFRR